MTRKISVSIWKKTESLISLMTMRQTPVSMVRLLEKSMFHIQDFIKQYPTGRDQQTDTVLAIKQSVDPLSRLGKIFIEKKDQYQIEISNEGVRILNISEDAYTNTTHALTNTADFVIGSSFVAIESRAEPLVHVNMEALEFSIAVKQRKHSLKFYVDRLPRRKNFGGLLGFGLSHPYQVKLIIIILFRQSFSDKCFSIPNLDTSLLRFLRKIC